MISSILNQDSIVTLLSIYLIERKGLRSAMSQFISKKIRNFTIIFEKHVKICSFCFLDTFESIELDQVQLIELTNLHLDFAEILSHRTLLFCGTSPGLSGENPFQDPIASLLRWESWDFQKKILENLDHIHKERMRIRRQWVSRPRDALGWKIA